jgi:hypothetical protein
MRDPAVWRRVVVEKAINMVEPNTFDIQIGAQMSKTLNVALT